MNRSAQADQDPVSPSPRLPVSRCLPPPKLVVWPGAHHGIGFEGGLCAGRGRTRRSCVGGVGRAAAAFPAFPAFPTFVAVVLVIALVVAFFGAVRRPPAAPATFFFAGIVAAAMYRKDV